MGNNLRIIFLTILLVLVTQTSYAATDPDEAGLACGGYLRAEYVKAVKKCQSPIEAEKGLASAFCRVDRRDGKYRISVGGWFDALSFFVGPDCLTLAEGSDPSLKAFKRISKKSFSVEREGAQLVYEYVGDNAGDWIARTLFTGKWVDEQKQIFDFRAEGVLMNGVNNSYTYARIIPPDWSGYGGPYSDVLIIGKVGYLFKLKDNVLQLDAINPAKPDKGTATSSLTMTRSK